MLKTTEIRSVYIRLSIWLVLFLGILLPSFFDNASLVNSLGSTLSVLFLIVIPGTFFSLIFLKSNHEFTSIILGSTILISIIVPLHAYFSKFGVSWILTGILSIILVYFILTFNKYLDVNEGRTDFKIKIEHVILIMLSAIIYILLFRQSLYVPSNNLDQFLVWPDTYNAIAQAGEISNHGPSIFPFVADAQVPLKYHWGAFSLGSFISLFGNFELVVSIFKTQFIFLGILYFGLLYITGKSIGKSWLSGIFSMILGGLTIYPNFPELNEQIGLARPFISSTSMPQFTANVFAVLAIYLIYNFENLKINNSIKFILIFFTTFSATLSKGPVGLLIVILVIFYLIFNFKIINTIHKLILFISSVLGFLIGYSQITSSNSNRGQSGTSLWLNPLDTLRLLSDGYGVNLTISSVSLFLSLFLISFSFLFFAITFCFNKESLRLIFPLIISSFAGISGTFLFETWGDSQLFLMYSVVPFIGILLSSAAFYKTKDLTSETILLIAIGIVGQPLLFNLFSSFVPRSQVLRTFFLWALSSITVLFVALIFAKILKKNFSYYLLVVSFSIGMFSGLNKFDQRAYSLPEHPYSISIGTYEIANYLKNNSDKSDLIATNRHCAGTEENQICTARQFAISAISERRVFLEGWSYTTCPLEAAILNKYWKADSWKANQDFFSKPSDTNFEILRNAGVDWLIVDSKRSSISNYDKYAELITQIKSISLWKIKNPYKGQVPNQQDPCGPNSIHILK